MEELKIGDKVYNTKQDGLDQINFLGIKQIIYVV
jgi:hypothetical protein